MSPLPDFSSFQSHIAQLFDIANRHPQAFTEINWAANGLNKWRAQVLHPFIEELQEKIRLDKERIDQLIAAGVAAEGTKNNAYTERNRVVAALSKCFPSHLGINSFVEGGIVWRVVFIDLPTGQATWHFPESEQHLFSHLSIKADQVWDGHTTEDKYQRLENLQSLAWAKPASDAADVRLNAMDEVVQLEARVRELERALGAKQAQIDSLMMEYCPDEMTPEQVEEWGKHQHPVDPQPILETLKQELIEAEKKKGEEPQRRVVCAANRYSKICIGIRHNDTHMNRLKGQEPLADYLVPEQGFVDQFGTFMTRTEAWKVAEAAGQIIRRCGRDDKDGGTLYSENLY